MLFSGRGGISALSAVRPHAVYAVYFVSGLVGAHVIDSLHLLSAPAQTLPDRSGGAVERESVKGEGQGAGLLLLPTNAAQYRFRRARFVIRGMVLYSAAANARFVAM